MAKVNASSKGIVRTMIAIAALALVASCGGGKDKVPEDVAVTGDETGIVERSRRDQVAARQREKRRQKLLAEKETDFEYFRYRIDTSGEQPLACFVFSGALDPDVDYSSYIDFRPAFRPALTIEGRELCAGGLSFGTSHTATLKSGLPAADGKRSLSGDESVPIDFADRPPYVGFKGAGIILPRSDADGVPIETVNVDQVKITVSRINDRALAFKRISEGETVAQGRYSYDYGTDNPSDVEEELWSGTMDIPAEQNAPVVSVFPLQDVVGTLKPGAYFIRVTDAEDLIDGEGPPASARRWIMLTDLALTAYEGQNGLDVTLRSLKDSKPLEGTDVRLIARNNSVLASAETNAQGRVSFDAPITQGTGNSAPSMVMAFGPKGDLAVLDLTRAPVDLSEYGVGGRRTPGLVDAYVYTDRGIYRPGETVELVAMLRNRVGERVKNRSGNLVIYRPNGLKAAERRFDDPDSGAVAQSYELPRGASRGEWSAFVEIDGVSEASGSVRFSVEDFVPQRIAVDLNADSETPLKSGETRDVQIDARFLYGAPGAGLTVKATARVEPQSNPFPAFEGFTFGKHDATFRERIIELSDQTTDGAGAAMVTLDPGTRGETADRPLRLNAVVSVLEPGGRAVSESVRIPYRSQPLYIGMKPGFEGSAEEGGDIVFEVAAINDDGNAVAERLKWKLLAIDYHYDWYNEDDRWRWRRSRSVVKVNEGEVNTEAGASTEIKMGGLDWGSHELIIEGPDGAIASDDFYVGWGGQTSSDGTEAPDRVRVMVPEVQPEIGDNAEVTIVAPYDGQAQVVVATDRVLSVQTLAVSEKGTRVSLPVTDDWGEGAYVMVSVYTERDPILQAKPRRAVGVAHVPVNMAARTFNVSIDAPDVARPRREQVIEIDIADGPREPVFLTLAAVDEGILALTKFKSPDPVAYYYGKKALEVSMYDDYGRLLDPNMALPAEIRSGGDQLGGEGLSVVPTKSVALFSGVVDVKRTGKAKVRFDLPDFNGELRLMAVVWSDSGVGSAEASMTVRDEAPSDLILPRFLAPGDEAFLTASIDNVELGAGAFNATISAAGPVSVADTKLSRTLQPGQRTDNPIRVESTEEGIARIRYTVQGPENFGVDHNYVIQSRSPYLPETRVTRALMEPGDEFSVDPKYLDGFLPGSVSVAVGFSTIPMDPAALYASLARYPYGCTEQTTSRALPLLYSEELVAMGGMEDRTEPRMRVQKAVNTILNRQGADGAFGLWREGDRYASPWLGAYATDFVYRAKEQGYAVPDEALERAYGALRAVSTGDRWRIYGYDADVYESRYSDDTQDKMLHRSSAYALYVLAKAGKADITRLRYLHDRSLDDIDSPLARAHIGAGLAYMGDRSRAVSAFEAAEKALGYNNSGDYYQTPLRDVTAMLALAAEAEMPATVQRLAERLSNDAPDPNGLTTQEKAFALLAVNALTDGETGFQMKVEGLGRGNNNERQYLLSEDQVGSGVSFELTGKAPSFRTVLVTGAPIKAPPPAASKLTASKAFYTLQGERVDLSNVAQGDQLVVSVSVKPEERRLNPVIIADLLPAGFEIETVLRPADGKQSSGRSGAFSFLGEIANAQTAQAQDDRFVAAIDVLGNTVTLAYVVRAVTPGEYALPGVVAEDMYRPDVFGRSRAGRVTITSTAGAAGGTP
jgi:uncharacterized protein YfaS (alpha-2-macroglobulin family)